MSRLRVPAREVVNFVVSQLSGCADDHATHTAVSGKIGAEPEQILEIRAGRATFDPFARVAKTIAGSRGHVDQAPPGREAPQPSMTKPRRAVARTIDHQPGAEP